MLASERRHANSPPPIAEEIAVDVIIADVLGEVALVLVVSSLLGAIAQRCGQPRVIGQILAGVLLGPTLLGRLPGHLTGHLFPKPTLEPLSVLANVAIVIFMFVVGYELDVRLLRGQRRGAPIIAALALLSPMALGIGAVFAFHSGFESLGAPHHLTRAFILFMGVAVSITALPVLAAIVRERGIAGTRAGIVALSSAGIMDALAWLLLAAALVGTAGRPNRPLAVTILLLVGFAVAMLAVVRPAVRWWMTQRASVLTSPLPVALTLALGSAWVTASLGLHPVFGGFLAGLAMPRLDGARDDAVLRPMEQIGELLLPLFFVVTGLSLDIGSLGPEAFAMLGLICVIAVAGKIGPGFAGARLAGLTPPESATVAVLVNTRGLTELIALNVGLSAGIISRQLFSVLVLMALATTLATSPLLSLIRLPARPATVPDQVPTGQPSAAADDV
jgi:Kef-type K+ transport system membrane component KefB